MKDKILRFEITDRCNMKCDMCWSKDWKHNDLSDKKVAKIIYDNSSHYRSYLDIGWKADGK